eukprot:TRINITY_DN54704_c0_g1_i1.p2 TRINITY_DN54704_c0_g1~~TRINITY_DN54704_c0_g1_i1.p2  ORF type:complete len:404 (+),score=211.05 TRINITY_DN54704_c0_g1_i1:88-1299(+)
MKFVAVCLIVLCAAAAVNADNSFLRLHHQVLARAGLTPAQRKCEAEQDFQQVFTDAEATQGFFHDNWFAKVQHEINQVGALNVAASGPAGPKKRPRACLKCECKYKMKQNKQCTNAVLKDIVRGSLVFKDAQKLLAGVNKFNTPAFQQENGFKIAEWKNGFKSERPPNAAGYQDIKAIIKLDGKPAYAEVQFHLDAMHEAKTKVVPGQIKGHTMYKVLRTINEYLETPGCAWAIDPMVADWGMVFDNAKLLVQDLNHLATMHAQKDESQDMWTQAGGDVFINGGASKMLKLVQFQDNNIKKHMKGVIHRMASEWWEIGKPQRDAVETFFKTNDNRLKATEMMAGNNVKLVNHLRHLFDQASDQLYYVKFKATAEHVLKDFQGTVTLQGQQPVIEPAQQIDEDQ